MSIGSNIKRLRGWMPQAELARRLKVSRATICAWEKGLTKISADMLRPLAAALGSTIEELLKDEPEEPSSQPPRTASELADKHFGGARVEGISA